MKDFVGLGGTLILGGGSSGRRTLLPLPLELLPLKPGGSAEASLAPLADLGGIGSAEGVQVLTGEVASWARVALTSTEGLPLAVEGQAAPLPLSRTLQLLILSPATPGSGGPAIQLWQTTLLAQLVLVSLCIVGAVQLLHGRRRHLLGRRPAS